MESSPKIPKSFLLFVLLGTMGSNLKGCDDVIDLSSGITTTTSSSSTSSTSSTSTTSSTTTSSTLFATSTTTTTDSTDTTDTTDASTARFSLGSASAAIHDDEAEFNDGDQDGLPDDQETERGTDSSNPDSDGDGLLDGFEVDSGSDPLNARSASIVINVAHSFARTGLLVSPDDSDGDGLSNAFEELISADPNKIDSDGNGVPDGLKLLQSNGVKIDASADADRDGLPDYMELLIGLDPYSPSTLKDGILDSFRSPPYNYKYKPFTFEFKK